MAYNEKFSLSLRAKLDEALNYGTHETPVQQLAFPEPTSSGIPSDTQTVVTQGETKPLGEPREDMECQKQGGPVDSEVLQEINSLLISIGYLLSKESIVPDKFNIPAILDFLSTHFNQVDPIAAVVAPEGPTEPVEPPTILPSISNPVKPSNALPTTLPSETDDNLEYANPVVNSYMESRRSFDKSLKIIK